ARTERGDPVLRLTRWLRDAGADPGFSAVPGGADLKARISLLVETLVSELAAGTDTWVGLVHGDVAPNNIVLDADGRIVALLDFDDCMHSHVAYDVCSILWAWGRTPSGRLDPDAATELVAAYASVRPLTEDERRLLP